jgi:ribosome recycling factor
MIDQQNLNKKIEELMIRDEQSLINNLEGIRSNRISIDFLKSITINAQERKIKLAQLASLRMSSMRNLVVSAFDKKNVPSITKSLLNAELGYKLEGTKNEIMYFLLLPMTEEIRTKLIKKCKEIFENSKVLIRNNRQKILNEIKNSKSLSNDQEKKLKRSVEDVVIIWSDKFEKIYIQKVDELYRL